MTVFTAHDFDAHEQVVFCYDAATNLKAIIAIHNTNRGPALGGTRFWPYASEEEALTDVLRLARGMTYKAALANLNLGGGKAVIIGDPKTEKTPEKMAAFGRFVERMNGLYITAEDVGTSPEDMEIIHGQTKHVVGLLGESGDPSILTAYGVFTGIKACLQHHYGHQSFSGIRIMVQGLGHVGMELARHLHEAGATLIVSDIDAALVQKAIKTFGATPVPPQDVFDVEADIFSPCALGGIINDQTINHLKCSIVAGAANNQLAESYHDTLLAERNILYAPDYLINAGGLINVTYEGPNYDREKVLLHVSGIYDTLLEIFSLAKASKITTGAACDHLAEQRFRKNSKNTSGPEENSTSSHFNHNIVNFRG